MRARGVDRLWDARRCAPCDSTAGGRRRRGSSDGGRARRRRSAARRDSVPQCARHLDAARRSRRSHRDRARLWQGCGPRGQFDEIDDGPSARRGGGGRSGVDRPRPPRSGGASYHQSRDSGRGQHSARDRRSRLADADDPRDDELFWFRWDQRVPHLLGGSERKMNADVGRPATSPPRLHYAWVVALVTFAVLLVTAGFRATPAILIIPLERGFVWTRTVLPPTISINLPLSAPAPP